MKYVIVIADGMADMPQDELGGRTPVEEAALPNGDYVAGSGRLGVARTIPAGFSPGSDVAVLCLLGYDPGEYYTGRAPLEAANMGLKLGPGDWAFRCNLVTVSDDTLEDYSAGHISDEEAAALITSLQDKISSDGVSFHSGRSYRHIMLYRGREDMSAQCVPPHDITGMSVKKNLPKGSGSGLLVQMMEDSRPILSRHDVNLRRESLKKPPANAIWLWGQGRPPAIPRFQEKYGVQAGAVITAVDLIRGLCGGYFGWDIIDVPGATGYLDTDYAAKGRYAVEALKDHDIVLVHVEAPDEAAHQGNVPEKIRAIENIDKHVLGPVLQALKRYGDYRILYMPDHYTVSQKRTHSSEPVPFAVCGTGIGPASGLSFSESNAAGTGFRFDKGHELMEYLLTG
ncbi:MAG: cofactor-independent phosphoglycerate mutase [Candidatus Brocadiales bacterium]